MSFLQITSITKLKDFLLEHQKDYLCGSRYELGPLNLNMILTSLSIDCLGPLCSECKRWYDTVSLWYISTVQPVRDTYWYKIINCSSILMKNPLKYSIAIRRFESRNFHSRVWGFTTVCVQCDWIDIQRIFSANYLLVYMYGYSSWWWYNTQNGTYINIVICITASRPLLAIIGEGASV